MSNNYSSLGVSDLIAEMRRAATECPESLTMTGWGKDPEVTLAHERYTDFLRATSPQNILRLLEYVESFEKDRKEAGRVFSSREVEELIKQAFRLAPEGYEWTDQMPTDINAAIDFCRMAADNPKVIRIPPPPSLDRSAHYTAILAAMVSGYMTRPDRRALTAEEALSEATRVLNEQGVV